MLKLKYPDNGFISINLKKKKKKKVKKKKHLISADDYRVAGFRKHDPKTSLLSAFAVSCGLTAAVSHGAL